MERNITGLFKLLFYSLLILLFSLLFVNSMNLPFIVFWIIAIVSLSYIWIKWFKQVRQYPKKVFIQTKHEFKATCFFLFICLFMIFGTISVAKMYEMIAPKNFIFLGPLYEKAIIIYFSGLTFFFSGIIAFKLKITSNENKFFSLIEKISSRKLYFGISFVLSLIIGYSICMNFVAVTPNEVIVYSPLNINGKVTPYQNIEKVHVGFSVPFFGSVSDFEYKVVVDGKKINLMKLSTYEKEPAELIEQLDKKLMQYRIPKTVDNRFKKNFKYDIRTYGRYLRILNNKN